MRARNGQILVLVAIGMIALLLVGGLAVDVGVWYKDQRSIEHAAELAAMRGYKEICEQGGVFDITDPADPVRKAIEDTLKVNGVSASEIASAQISVDKSGVVSLTLSRQSPSLFSRVGGHSYAPVAGLGQFETNRIAPFAIPEQYNDEDRDQRPNYDPADPAQLIDPPYTDPSFQNCSYIPGSPYIILYSIETAQTTHDWVFIPMDDTAAKIPLGKGAFGSMGSFECPYSALPLGTKEGSAHLPYFDGASLHEAPGGVYDQADLPGGSAQLAYYLLWQKTFDLATNMSQIFQIPLFRAYGVMWDVLGAPAQPDGQYPFIAWFRGLHGGAFAVQRRHLEAAGYKLVRCPGEVNDPGGNAFNKNDYVRIERVSDDADFTPTPPARKAGDTGVRALLLRFGPYGQNDSYGQPLDFPPGNEDEYIRHVMRSVAFVRWYNELNEDGRIKSIEFGRSTTSEATRIQPRIATYTGTTDPVTRVLSWSGIPFDACFGDYDPRIELDPNTTCKHSFCLRDEILASGGSLSSANDILNYLRTHVPAAPAGKPKRGYHWLHVHHENFAQDIETDPDVRAMALAIRNFVADGGFLFDACLGAETLEAALAYLEQETPPNPIEGHGEYAGLNTTLAHDRFHIKKSATGKLRICIDGAGTEADLAAGLPATVGMSTVYGYFSLTDPRNSRSQCHTGYAAGTAVVDYEDPTGTGPLRIVSPAEAAAEAIRFYGGSYMGFDGTLLKNDETPGVTAGLESGTTLEDRANVVGHDVVYKLGSFDRSWDGSIVKAAKPDGLVYVSGTVTGTGQGQFALIGGHLPHHDPYTVLTREYFIEGAWYHRTSTHVSWKWNKVFKGDPKDRGDGLTYDTQVPVASPTPCNEEAVIAWRGGLARNRYRFYTDGTWNWNEPWTWTGTWGEYTGGHWDPAAHWSPAPTWTDSDGWLGWQSHAGWEWDSEEGYVWVGAWVPGHWVGGTWVPGNWVADWWETSGTWTWAGYWSWDGWSYYPNSDLRQRFGRNTSGASQAQCEAYLEVLGDLMFLHSNWWSCVPAGTCDLSDGHRGPGRLPLTLSNDDGSTAGDVLAFKGQVTMTTADSIGNRMDPTNQRYPSLDARLAGQWGTCWPTIYEMPDNHVDINTNTIEEFYNNSWNVGAGLLHNCLRLSDTDATTLSDTNLVGANNSWQAVKSQNVAGGHRPEANAEWDAFRMQLGALDMDNSRTYEIYRSVTMGRSLTERWSGHNRFVWHREYYYRYFLGLPRWSQFQILLDELDNVQSEPNVHAPSSFLPPMEYHGLDMCVRDVDNNGITGDIYAGGAIYRGVPDVAFHRLYLNNILLGALSAEIPNFGGGGMNCGAVNWGGMGAGAFASGASPFNVNSFVDIMRLGLKGGGLRVGDTFWTSPGDFKDAVRNGAEYMFTDTSASRVRIADDPANASTVTWAEYVNNLAPEKYYRYKGVSGKHLYNSAAILSGTSIKKAGMEFARRPAQIMTMACVERTDGNDKSIYFTPHGAPASSIEVKVIGFARFFLIDKDIDDLTYNAISGDHDISLVPKDAANPTRETLFLGPDPTLPGELRGHFLGWEVKPPNP